jgi:hypothetical protein
LRLPPPSPPPAEAPAPPAPPGPPAQAPAPASFRLSNLSIVSSVVKTFKSLTYLIRTGQEATISVDLTNIGGQAGSYPVILMVNGVERERQEVTLGPGQTQTVTFTLGPNEPGSYTIQIGDLNGSFVSELWVNWWLFVGTAGLFALLGWGIWFFYRRIKRKSAPSSK